MSYSGHRSTAFDNLRHRTKHHRLECKTVDESNIIQSNLMRIKLVDRKKDRMWIKLVGRLHKRTVLGKTYAFAHNPNRQIFHFKKLRSVEHPKGSKVKHPKYQSQTCKRSKVKRTFFTLVSVPAFSTYAFSINRFTFGPVLAVTWF